MSSNPGTVNIEAILIKNSISLMVGYVPCSGTSITQIYLLGTQNMSGTRIPALTIKHSGNSLVSAPCWSSGLFFFE